MERTNTSTETTMADREADHARTMYAKAVAAYDRAMGEYAEDASAIDRTFETVCIWQREVDRTNNAE
jgi:hypothetical protein